MIHLPASVRVYLCLTPCDMRKSFDSLQALVREQLELDAFAGHLFVFLSLFFNPAEGPSENLVLGSRRLRRLEQAVGGGDVRSSV
jgi:transposase